VFYIIINGENYYFFIAVYVAGFVMGDPSCGRRSAAETCNRGYCQSLLLAVQCT